jgi:hypothetical protein
MSKYESLRATVAHDGPDDVVVIGSSVIRRGVIPDVVAGVLEQELEAAHALRVFNYGVPGHNVLTYPMLVGLITGVDRPRLLVLSITARSIDANVGHLADWAEIALGSPYGRAVEDTYVLRGRLHRFLLDHWLLPTYAPSLRSRLVGERRGEARERGRYAADRGYIPARMREITPRMLERQSEIASEWDTNSAFQRALDRAVARAQRAGSEVLLVDAPIRPRMVELMRDPERNLGGLRRFLCEARVRLGVDVALTPEGLVPDEEFADLTHLLPEGAGAYSRWLGHVIARHYPDLRVARDQ